MTGQEWLQYFMAQEQPERKNDWLDWAGTGLGAVGGFFVGGPPGAMAGASLGGALGNTAENASNKTLSPGGLVSDAVKAVGGYNNLRAAMPVNIATQGGGTQPELPDPFDPGGGAIGGGGEQAALLDLLRSLPIGMAGGGMVPNMEQLMAALIASQRGNGPQTSTGAPGSPPDPFSGMSAEDIVGPAPAEPQYAQAKHPGWEAAARVLSDVLAKLPPPRAGWNGQNQTNKTIGAYMPAAAALAGAIPSVAQARREEVNKPLREEYASKVKNRDLLMRQVQLERVRAGMKPDGADELTPKQYADLGVPEQYRSKAGYAAWKDKNQRSDTNLNRLQIRAAQTKDIAQFPEIRDAYNKIGSSAAGGTGVSDMALVFSFMRVLDPTSVVREGEYERAIKTEGIPGWVWASVQRVKNGALLTPEQRKRMVSESKAYFEQKRGAYRRARQWVDRIANYYGLDPELAIPNLESPDVYIGVSPNQPQGGMDGGADEYGVPVPKLKEAGR